MVDKGYLKYTDRVADHWPEFAQNGKHFITVADVLRHECGLTSLREPMETNWLKTEAIKQNKIGQIIETDSPIWLSDEKISDPENARERYYHGTERDWVTNEIFRRVEPKGRTMGEYLREELGEFDIHVGLRREEDFERIEPMRDVPLRQ